MNLLYKECKLCLSPLTPLFLLFSLLALIPNYPLTLAGFFISFGIFQSFQKARESGDILYSALLPIPKRDVARAKYLLTVVFESCGLLLLSVFSFIRSRFLLGLPVYASVALLGANFTMLSIVTLIFLSFNVLFLGGFFKTAYKFGGPFVSFIVCAFLLISVGEVLPHIPGLSFLGGAFDALTWARALIFAVSLVLYVVGTLLSMRISQRRFEKIDL